MENLLLHTYERTVFSRARQEWTDPFFSSCLQVGLVQNLVITLWLFGNYFIFWTWKVWKFVLRWGEMDRPHNYKNFRKYFSVFLVVIVFDCTEQSFVSCIQRIHWKLSPWKTPPEIWTQKTHIMENSHPENWTLENSHTENSHHRKFPLRILHHGKLPHGKLTP